MSMGKTWILVADHRRAQLYLNVGPGRKLSKVKEIPAPPEQTIRHTDSHDGQDRRHDGEEFAGQLSQLLSEGRVGRQYEKLILVAGPKFLGQIRAKLDKATHSTVSATLDKDLAQKTDPEIVEQIASSFFTF